MRRIVQVCVATLVFSLLLGLAGCFMGGRPESVRFDNGLFGHWNFIRMDDDPSASTAVQVPQGNITALEFDLGGGEVTVQGGDGFSIDVRKGSIRQNQVKNGVWKLENGTKDWSGAEIVVTVPQNQVLEHLDMEVGTGRLTLENLRCKTAQFEVGVGSLNASNITVEQKSDVVVELGQVQFDGSLLGKTSVQCEMGDVKMELARPKEYGYRVEGDLAAVSIDGQSFDGLDTSMETMSDAPNFYEIQCDLGNVQISFE